MSKYLRLGIYALLAVLITALWAVATLTGAGYGWLYAAVGALLLFAVRPSSAVHRPTMARFGWLKTVVAVLVALITIVACILPMDAFPIWNGEDAGHRNQYEVMAESILDGHIDLYYDEEDALADLDNPYDPAQREGRYYHWDHAYYEGHYYMYFGVVPVFLAFLPYRVITGTALTTFHATQLFVAVFIVGVFLLFRLLAKLFFKNMSFSAYVALSVAVSVMSVWYATAEPALYCTAITAALALEIWSIYFFVRAVWGETRENRQILLAAVGALLGALVFGCRPPIALANLLVVPMLIVFIRQRRFGVKLLGKLVLAALPYVVVAAALMVYNYARFDNPFEFGQAYQLTVADQTNYKVMLDKATILRVLNGWVSNFLYVGGIRDTFPYTNTSGVLWNFPILLMGAGLFRTASLHKLREHKLGLPACGLFATVLIITAMDVVWTPFLLERYNMDIYFLMGITCFLGIGLWFATVDARRRARLSAAAVALSGLTVVGAFLYCVYTMSLYYPDTAKTVAAMLHLA